VSRRSPPKFEPGAVVLMCERTAAQVLRADAMPGEYTVRRLSDGALVSMREAHLAPLLPPGCGLVVLQPRDDDEAPEAQGGERGDE
jgi:hypothetical protein